MIVRITFQFQRNTSYIPTKMCYGENALKDLPQDLKEYSDRLKKEADLCQHLQDNPDCNVAEAIKQFTGRDVKPTILTKKKRTYATGYLYIHEEDNAQIGNR